MPEHCLEILGPSLPAQKLMPSLTTGSVRDEIGNFQPGFHTGFRHEIAVYLNPVAGLVDEIHVC